MKRIVIFFLISLVCLSIYIIWPTSFSKGQLNKLIETSRIEELSNSGHAVLIDYSKPVFKKRLWLIDLRSKKILLNCHVSHARNSGLFWVSKFSNKVGSEFSCTGKFKTSNSYESKYGTGPYKVGLRLEGLDADNDNTFKRNIVFHTSFPMWSKGCFMTLEKNNKFIIDNLKMGSLVLVLK